MNGLGLHLLLELNECNQNSSMTLISYGRHSLALPTKSGPPWSVNRSIALVPRELQEILAIAESHISIHTWPELEYAAADIFACGSSFRPREAAEILVERLQSRNPDILEVERGMTQRAAIH